MDAVSYFLARYSCGRPFDLALVVGCGFGWAEREFSLRGGCQAFDAFDVSQASLDEARRRSPSDTIVNYFLADGNTVRLPNARYDLVICSHSLHHIANLEHLLGELAQSLKPGGVLYLDEFVGPNRWQWTNEQLRIANQSLRRIPERFRTCRRPMSPSKLLYFLASRQYRYDRRSRVLIKERVARPPELFMLLNDASESVRSHDIPSVLPAFFDVVEERPYGGTLLNLIVTNIGGNFSADDPEARELLEGLVREERELIATRQIPSDHVFVVGRPKQPKV